jgi:hypothetical protein
MVRAAEKVAQTSLSASGPLAGAETKQTGSLRYFLDLGRHEGRPPRNPRAQVSGG